LILEFDEDWAIQSKEIIARKMAFGEHDLATKRMSIPGGGKVYDYALEILEER